MTTEGERQTMHIILSDSAYGTEGSHKGMQESNPT